MKKIILAGGCFWGVEAYFKRLKGVVETKVGYTDGPSDNPTYQDVTRHSGHAEAVFIGYDDSVVSLVKILEQFLRIVDPTLRNRQGGDIGIQYRTGLYLFTEEELQTAKDYLNEAQKGYSKQIQTSVKMAGPFYDAEEYHQDYLDKNPTGYCHVNLHLAREDEIKEDN
jgi:peptide-methionine (S)-S-oxide reductase